ncbi:hypothetical protein CHS0354_041627 [Potamilus streckersoni]|uniref:Ig-like domain-containing protein n=1 Tax=Potamilus streckersoni TaxID=2493646 RepID=A0AAE0SCG8_9BIVA|nr:hypothetical protein CHS0354_041627 [Potamilus streckersoni]
MLYIYTSIAVLFGGAYCFTYNNTSDKSPCTVVIKSFGKPVTTLEVKWNSTIHLLCDASCVGPGPQPALTWFYRKKTQSKLINIDRQIRSPKFDTYPLTSHRTKELRIRDFGPDEETMFICKGSIRGTKQTANVTLIGTDCLMKYEFRCHSSKRCIDRGQHCNYNFDCPDGEDEVGCGNNIYNTTTEATKRMPEKDVVINQTSEESDYVDITTSVSTLRITEKDVETMQTSADRDYVDITSTVSTLRITETDVKTMQTSTDRKPCDFQCRDGTCIASTKKCDGIPDCPHFDDENCEYRPICPEGKKTCKDSSKCIDDWQLCNGVQDCADGSDEVDCEYRPICPEGRKTCKDSSKCIDDWQLCNRVQDCADGSDEVDCGTKSLRTKASKEDDDKYDEVIIKTIMGGTGIHVDGETDPASPTDGVSARTTTSFGYEDYI